jgi:TatD DNase family protein
MITDSHCHLDYPVLFDKLNDVVDRALNKDIKFLLTICTTLESFKRIKLIVNKFKNIYGTFGIHPHESKNFKNINSDLIIKHKNEDKKIIGIGETGLDYYYNHSDKIVQKKVFVQHIEAAKKLDIPLIVHSRNAELDTFDILKNIMKDEKLRVIIHCFAGSRDFAEKLINIGCYISISGIITFKNSNELVNAVSFIPIDKLLVETDSPYLAPIPNRGKNNEPSFIIHTIEKLSIIKKVDKKIIIKNTTNNFNKLFKLK